MNATAARPTDSRDRAHYYKPSGEPMFSVPCKSRDGDRAVNIKDCRDLGLVPSPSTIVRLLHRPMLEAWKIEQSCLAVLTTPKREAESLDEFVQRVINTDEVQNEERNAAAERGKLVHAAIADHLSGLASVEFIDPMPLVVKVATEIQKLGRVVAIEKRIVGKGYCGTTDVILENPEEVWDVDFKTCRKIPPQPYDEQKLQISAYAAGLGNTGNKRIRSALCYVHMDTAEVKIVETAWETDYRRFQLLLEFWRLTNKI